MDTCYEGMPDVAQNAIGNLYLLKGSLRLVSFQTQTESLELL